MNKTNTGRLPDGLRIKKRLIKAGCVITVFAVLFLVTYFALKNIFPLRYQDSIAEYSSEYSADPYLIMGIIRAESGFDPAARSRVGAMGLMQITNETAAQIAGNLGINDYITEDLYTPEINIRFGIWYVNWLYLQLDGNIDNVLAAYNAGIGNVRKWLSDKAYSKDGKTLETIPYKETENFINRVKLYSKVYRALY